MLQAWYGMVHFVLDIFRKGAGHSSDVHFICVKAFWLNEYLMAFFVCKTDGFIFDGRAITRTGSFDHSGIKRGSVQVCADDLVCFFVCVGQPAGFLLDLYGFRVCGEGERYDSFVSELLFHFGIIDGVSGDPGRGSCFEAEHFDSQFFQRIREIVGCLKAVWSCVVADIAVDAAGLEVGSCTENYGFCVVGGS